MKKTLTSVALILTLTLATMFGCSNAPVEPTAAADADATASAAVSKDELVKIVVGATPTPHGEILEFIKPLLEAKGYELEIKEFTDYVLPNKALEEKSIDANYFQHKPYLDDYVAKNASAKDLVSAAAIHYEPFGMYAGKSKSLDDIKKGTVIAVPNDTTNEARALLLLEANGYIKLKEGVGLEATKKDIVENSKEIEILEIDAALLTRQLPDVDFAIINSNFAIQGNLDPSKDSLIQETSDSIAAKTYANIIAVNKDDLESDKIKALIEVLQTPEVKEFIESKYTGAVVPTF